ncbi:MAG: amidohydrolase [Ardenticatenia bacterium]|jgi:5-methylthioadenosine/S-adenosylhomocysteine deaminase|nr:MAG: amidohydrolase [Ardenticatenia bacterium]
MEHISVRTADWLLTHGIVVTMDAARRTIPDGAVAVRGNGIVAVGPTAELEQHIQAAQTVDCTHCAIIPGLINAHTHAPMTLLRGLADDLRLDVWLYGYMMPVEREFVGADFCRVGTLLACAEMIRSGVSTFCDMYYYEEEVAYAAAEAGMRALCAETLLKFPSPDATSYEESLEYARTFIERWRGHPLIVPGVAPHAAYTVTPELLHAAVRLAVQYDVPLQIHIAETRQEVEDWQARYGEPIIPWLERHGVLDARLIAIHCVHLDEREMHILQAHNAGLVHCPSSNLKLASGVADVPKMIHLGLHVGIGTDGPASNNDLDMFEETRLAALLAKGCSGDPVAVPAPVAFAMATIEGAKALHLAHAIGSLEEGKCADIAVVTLNQTHQLPAFRRDPDAVYSQLVYATKSSDVRDLMVNGRWLMRERRLLTLDEEVLRDQAQQFARRIDSFLMAREGNLLSKLLAVGGGIVPQETYEVQVKVRLSDVRLMQERIERMNLGINRPSRRNQYDTYMLFQEGEQGRLRYREDEVLGAEGKIQSVEYTLTLVLPMYEKEYDHSVVLTRSRYTAPANRSLRFYREFFKPNEERQVVKHRYRFHIMYRDTDFAVNLDELVTPAGNAHFLEIKSRTWSARDAEHKARLIGELLELMEVEAKNLVKVEYVDLVSERSQERADG